MHSGAVTSKSEINGVGRAAALGLFLFLLSAHPAGAQAKGTPDAAPVIRGPLAVRDLGLVYADGTPFRWRGITAFALLDQVADGRERDARAFLRWARARGFNVVRVLGMAHHLFRLTPSEGLKAIPRLLRLAAEADLYVELVVFADTREYPELSLTHHVDAVAAAIAGATNVVVELANENDHRTQVRKLIDPALLVSLRARFPAKLLLSLGSLHGPDDVTNRFPGGDYLTAHLYRGGEAWQQVGRIPALARMAASANRPVINDEPIGAGERLEPGRRLVDPSAFFAIALLGRMAGIGTTFHCEDCLFARTPGPIQTACAEAFMDGSRLVPDATEVALAPAAGGDGPLATEPVPGAAGVHVASVSSGQWHLVVALGLGPGAAMPWRPGWSATVLRERPGVRVYRARQLSTGPAVHVSR